jgi:hypothetical protein
MMTIGQDIQPAASARCIYKILQSYFPNVSTTDDCVVMNPSYQRSIYRLSTVPSADPGTKVVRRREE